MCKEELTIEVFKSLLTKNQEQEKEISQLNNNLRILKERDECWEQHYRETNLELRNSRRELKQTKQALNLLIKTIPTGEPT